MRGLFCRAVRTTLAARVLDTGNSPYVLESHVASCLRCQAVVAQSLRLRRTLADVVTSREIELNSSSPPVGWMAAGVASLAAAALVARMRQQDG